MLNNLKVGIYVFQNGRFVFTNRELSRISGYSEEEFRSMNPFQLIADKDQRDAMMKFTKKALEGDMGELPFELILLITKKDGSDGWVALRPLPAIYGGEPAILCSVFDVTEKKIAERKREEVEKFVELTRKIIRHDLSNKLSAAFGFLDIYLTHRDETILKRALESIESCIQILNRMQDLEMLIRSGNEMKPFSVREVFENVGKHYEIELEISGDCEVTADDGIYSVVENLICNSVRHGKSRRIEVNIVEKVGHCEIKVSDDGIGIPENVRENIFQEGYSTGGGGLGLYIVNSLMQKYGGSVTVEDSSSGATFLITFPL
nr:PAS domain-containing sensor histidine kinase [Archaeoglobus neptunius]